MPITFTRAAVKEDGAHTVWYGTNPNMKGASLVTVASDRGGFDSVLIIPGSSQFSFRTDPDGFTFAQEFVPEAEHCLSHELPPAPTTVAARFPYQPQAYVGTDTASILRGAVANAQLPTVDVLFIYDRDTLDHATTVSSDPIGYIEGQIRARLESANVVLANSLISNFQWRTAAVVAAPASMPANTNMSGALSALVTAGETQNWLKQMRHYYGGDQAMLLKGTPGTDASGMAYAGNQTAPTSRDMAVSACNFQASYKILTHELGHNFGCMHDRNTDNAQEDNGRYNHGIIYRTEAYGQSFSIGTIMAYGSMTIPYFSNPEITLPLNSALADLPGANITFGTYPIGKPVGESGAANNAKVMSDNALIVAAFYTDPTTAPTISTQPSDTSAVRGSSYSFTVIATGDGLAYQWHRNGAPISGATSAIFSDTADDADAGNYTVTVSNRLGSVTSREARLTVTAPAQNPPSSGGGSSAGGGGGGGSPSLWFTIAIIAALFHRIRQGNLPKR